MEGLAAAEGSDAERAAEQVVLGAVVEEASTRGSCNGYRKLRLTGI
jgi:hypothetical protein